MKKGLKVAVVGALATALVACCALSGCNHEKAELQIFAANSLSAAMEEAQAKYTETHSWITFKDTQYLGSGKLVEQLAGGAYADALITAATSNMDTATEKGLVDSNTTFNLFTNDLVVVVKKDSDIKISSLDDIIKNGYTLAVGSESVPAGNYARQALYNAGYYTDASGKGGNYQNMTKPLEAASVGEVAKYVASGEIQCGIAYLSDIYRNEEVEVAFTIPSDQHKAIIYPASVCASSNYAQATKEFLDWCKNDSAAKQIWQKYGFALA